MRRRAWLFAGAGSAALAAGFLWRWRQAPPPSPGATAELWTTTWPTPDGGELAMSSLRGRPLVLNFWATWCPPCVRELPLLDRFHRDRAKHGWQVLALAVDEAPAVRQFLERMPVALPIALAGARGLTWSQKLGNAGGGLPFTVAIGALGDVIERKVGETSQGDLQRWAAISATPPK